MIWYLHIFWNDHQGNDFCTLITNVWNSRFLYSPKMCPVQNLNLWSAVFLHVWYRAVFTLFKPLRGSLMSSPLICVFAYESTSDVTLSSHSCDPSDNILMIHPWLFSGLIFSPSLTETLQLPDLYHFIFRLPKFSLSKPTLSPLSFQISALLIWELFLKKFKKRKWKYRVKK